MMDLVKCYHLFRSRLSYRFCYLGLPASYAGLAKGDIISRVNGSRIYEMDDFLTVIKSAHADSMELEILRNGSLFDDNDSF